MKPATNAKGMLFPARGALLSVLLGFFVSAPAWAVPPTTPPEVNFNFDFRDSATYSTSSFVSALTNWSTTDQWLNNGFLPVENIPNAINRQTTGYTSGQASFIGGLYGTPTVPTSELIFSFDPQGNTRWTFNWVQNLANAADDDGIRDTFGWSVLSTSQNPILTLKFSPGIFPGTDGLNYNTSAEVFAGGISSSNNAANGLIQEVGFNRGEWVSFELNLNTIEETWSVSIGSVNEPLNTFLMSGVIDILEGTEVGGISQFWDLADPLAGTQQRTLDDETTVVDDFTGAGLNVMMVETLSVNGVPEPSSASLVIFGSLGLLAARRRRRSHS